MKSCVVSSKPFPVLFVVSGCLIVNVVLGLSLWVSQRGSCQLHSGHSEASAVLAIASTEGRFFTGGEDRTVRCWSESGDVVGVIDGQGDQVTALEPSPNESWLVIGTGSGAVRIVDFYLGVDVDLYQVSASTVTDLWFHPARHWLYSFCRDGSFLVRDVWGRETVRKQRCQSGVISTLWLTKGDQLLLGCLDGEIRQLDPESAKISDVWSGHAGPVKALATTGNADRVFSVSTDRIVFEWRVGQLQPRRRVRLASAAEDACITVDGRFLLVAQRNGSIVVLSVDEFKVVGEIATGLETLLSCEINSQGIVLATGYPGLVFKTTIEAMLTP